ncbi:MAG: class A beta-lactamase-related serine hydrolase [Pelatocladus maniniholoensis HA4357-MV3]|jgi:beta-lactamase class A|uniref:Class A beta-lactamase-related serine hydrolase n=1 Tax=Pelatocladus maniniholoensis HA4357-MV3 TaxID=1117104 RepID=A0A9E3LX76_9NOST|nr:class A beta-lactamase-related serine hydrolase [Pelatocladus maniniholoensis HA4357-MV3]BAZ69098.1 peptidoglycan glycosyltransferase [Fischerella sp. NIES-4106]
METRTNLPGFSRSQPVNGRQKPIRKVQKLGKSPAKLSSQQQRPPQAGTKLTRVKATSAATPVGVAKKRPSVVVPAAVKALPAKPGQIPPYKPSNAKVKTVRSRKQALPKKVRTSRKTRLKPMARTMLYALRLLIVGIGIGAIVGTVLSVLDPANQMTTTETSPDNTKSGQAQIQAVPTPTPAAVLSLSQEITSLKTNVQSLASANPNLTPGVFVVDLENGSYVDINASASFPAASTIKVPILLAFFQDVDAGKIRLDEMLTMEKEMMALGSGDMRYKPAGSQFKALEVANKMITISDNTATNMLIARMGGIEALNQRFRSWGLNTTVIRNQLPDLDGTNTTSPKELGNLMAMVSQGNLISMTSRDRILEIMRNTVRNQLLPTGLGQGATIAHKTGDIGTMLADAGLVDLPTGKRYIVAVMVKRPNNDPSAEKLIGSISKAAYQQFTQTTPSVQTPAPTPTPTAAPSITPNPIPTTRYQPPLTTPTAPLPTITQPTTNYQPYPLITPPLPNTVTSPLPPTGYQYQPPLTNQPPYYYYPPSTYQR